MEKPTYEAYSELPQTVLSKHYPDRWNDEDMLQEGRLELWLSIRDADKARDFLPYAWKRILRCYHRYLKAQAPAEDTLDGVDPADKTGNDFEESRALCESISRILKDHPDECRVLCLKAKGYSFQEIAVKMGLDYHTARRLAKRGGKKLRERGAL